MHPISKKPNYFANGAYNTVSPFLSGVQCLLENSNYFDLDCRTTFIGSSWKHVEGYTEGQTATCSNKFGNTYCAFAHPIDIHLACRGIQGWPKIHIEVYAVNALNQCWPVG